MTTREWVSIVTLGLFVIPVALLLYAARSDGSSVEDGIYWMVQALREEEDLNSAGILVDVGRFLIAWWWPIAMVSFAVSTLFATFLAATDPYLSVAMKALWVLSFYLVGVTVPVYCIWQVGSRPNQLFKPTPSARLNSRR